MGLKEEKKTELLEMVGVIEYYADWLETLAEDDLRLNHAAGKLNEALSDIVLALEDSSQKRLRTPEYIKLEIYIPETHLPQLQVVLREVDAGHIGSYDSCLSYSPVTGTWRPLNGTHPYLGEQGEISAEPEMKVEVTIRAAKLKETIAAVKAIHPYEEPVINAIPLVGVGV